MSFYVWRCQSSEQLEPGDGNWTTDQQSAIDVAKKASGPTNVLRGTVTEVVFYPVRQEGSEEQEILDEIAADGPNAMPRDHGAAYINEKPIT